MPCDSCGWDMFLFAELYPRRWLKCRHCNFTKCISSNPSLNPDPIIQYFNYKHLPEKLRQVSAPFCELALALVGPDGLPRNPERTVALRKLLEAKDAAVRAALDDVVPDCAIRIANDETKDI